ncbi:MAG: iron dicitrate transport regulator FecR [Verrucomicrobiota bacterium]
MKSETLIFRYLSGDATSDEVAELDRLLAENGELRKQFIFEAGNDAGLREIALERQSSELESEPRVISPIFRPAAWLAAAAAVAMLGVLIWTQISQPNVIAVLVSSEDASWESSLPTEPGSALTAGRMKLTSGIATIRFRSGAEITLEAPAKLSLKTPMLAWLGEGAAVMTVPEQAIGFVLETPDGNVIDYGTTFAVDVEGEGELSNVEVIDGEVGVFIPETGKEVRLLDQEGAFMGDRKIATYQGPLPEAEVNRDQRIRRIGTRGRSYAVIRANREKWLHHEMLLVRRKVEATNHERRSFFAFDLAEVDFEEVAGAQVRLNQVPSGLGYASRLPLISEIAVYGLVNSDKADWKRGVEWEASPSPEDGVLLGYIQIPRSQQRASRVFTSEALMGFLKEHEGRSVTFILDRDFDSESGAAPSLAHAFASDIHPEAAGPKLELILKN